MRTLSSRRAFGPRTPREETRLQLVALAAEVATVARRVREQVARYPGRHHGELQQRCYVLEQAATRWLSHGVRFEDLSDRDLERALAGIHGTQRESVVLMLAAETRATAGSLTLLMESLRGLAFSLKEKSGRAMRAQL